tara:strand:- start:97 stop:660 length:564 start_codon:yes stop_codon:yes gene_type:complete
MSFTRRQFLLSTAGAAGGFILPSFYSRALEFLDQFGEPLLEPPKRVVDELIICWDRDGELNLGDPWEQPPDMTWRQFLTQYHPETLDELENNWGLEEWQLDDEAPWDTVVEPWGRVDSPNARAYHLLESLDLGSDLTGSKAVGGLIFTDGPCPGNDYLGVSVEDNISISLLQQRLNDLKTGIKVSYG